MVNRGGFTLTEVLITVIIIGVLAGLAVPSYFSTVEQSRSNEARANLNVIYTAEKIFLLNNNTFWPAASSNNNLANINTNLNTDLSAQYYTLFVTANAGTGAGATFTATATRGNSGSKQFMIDQTGIISESGNY